MVANSKRYLETINAFESGDAQDLLCCWAKKAAVGVVKFCELESTFSPRKFLKNTVVNLLNIITE